MIQTREVLDLVGLSYECAGQPAAWGRFLSRLAEAFDAQAAALDFYDVAATRGGAVAFHGIDPVHIDEYVQHFGAVNILWQRMERESLLAPGQLVENRLVIDDSEFAKTEYCSDFLQKRLGVFHAFGATLLRTPQVTSNLSILRKRSRPVTEHDRVILRLLVPHLQRSLALHRKLAAAELERHLMAETIHLVDTAVILLKASGTVFLMNAAAETILRRRDGLRLQQEEIIADDRTSTTRLRQLIREAAGVADARNPPSPRAIAIARPEGRRPYSVFVTRLHAPEAGPEDEATVAIFIVDPDRVSRTNHSELRREYFGLTATETRLSDILLGGGSVAQAAESLGIRPGTARQHLKALFLKTGTHRQGELVLRLANVSQGLPNR